MNFTNYSSLRRAGLLISGLKGGLWTALLSGLMLLPAVGQTTRTWTGADSANWSDPNNWEPAGVPQNGDSLVFSIGTPNTAMNNDLGNLSVNTLTFEDADCQLDGNSLTVQKQIDNTDRTEDGNSHTTTINCPLVFPNGGLIDTAANDGLLTETTIDIHMNGPIENNGNLALRAAADDLEGGANGNIYISGVISGPGNIQVEAQESGGNVSTVQFSGTPGNTFTGGMYLSSLGNGQIIFDKSSGVVVSNAIFSINGGANLVLSGPNQIGNNAIITMNSGTLALSGNNVTVGTLVFTNFHSDALPALLDASSITVGLNGGIATYVNSDVAHPTIKGKLNLNGLAEFNVNGGGLAPGLEIPAVIEGVGFNKTGGDLLLLDGNNVFTGNLEITAGTVVPTNAAALSPASAGVVFNGGNLLLQGLAIGAEPMSAIGPNSTLIANDQCSWAGPVSLSAILNVLPQDTTSSGKTMNFTGAITGSGGITMMDSPNFNGTMVLAGSLANTFTGPLTVLGRLLELDKPFDITASAGPIIAGGGSAAVSEVRWLNSFQDPNTTLTIYTNGLVNLNNLNEDFDEVTFNGGTVESGSGQFGILQPLTVNPAGVTAVINGNLGLISASPALFNVPLGSTLDGVELQINAAIIGTAPQLVKKGGGTILLVGANSSAATTFLEEGALAVDNASALSVTPFVISSGATMEFDVSTTLSQHFEMAGDGINGTLGALDLLPGVSVILSSSTGTIDTETTLNIGQGSALVISGAVSGAGPLTETGLGEIELAGGSANTYSGGTFVNQGILALDKNNGIAAVPGNLTIGTVTPTHNFGTSGTAFCVGNGEVGGTNVTVNGGSVYELEGNNQTLVNVTLNRGGTITTGSGTLTLTGGNTADVVAVAPGISGASVISGNLLLSDGGTFVVAAPTEFTPGNGLALDVQAALSDSGPVGIAKSGTGEMRLSSGNSFSSPMTVIDGKLTLANSFALGNAVTIDVTGSSQLALEGGISISDISLTLNSSAPSVWQSLNGSNFWNGNVVLSQTAAIDVEPTNGYLGSLNAFSGPGGLTALGPGTLDFEGSVANTYAGLTAVSNGVVQGGRFTTSVTHNKKGQLVTNEVAVTSFPGDVVIGSDATSNNVGTLRTLHEAQLKVANVTVHLSGLLDMPSVFGELDGPRESLATLTGAGTVNIGLNSSLTIFGNASFTFDGTINGSGGFIKQSSGTMITSGNVNTTGNVQLTGGNWILFGARHNGGIEVFNSGGNAPRLGGDGTVDGTVTMEGANIGVDSHFPDHQGSALHLGSLTNATVENTLQLDMFGPSPTGGNDQIVTTSGGVSLFSDTMLSTSFSYPPREGDVIDLISVPSGQTITGNFANFPDGVVTLVGTTPVVPSYEGGSSGHDFTLTVTNLALAYTGYQLAEGNGNQTVEPNECNLMYVSLINRRATALTITNAILRATTAEGVVVTVPMASYPVIPAGQTMTNLTPFQFSTDTNLPCGGLVTFELVLGVVNEGQFAIDFSPVSGSDCTHPTGPCDSCSVASGQFDANTPTTLQPLYFVGAPSICFPPKAYPGTNPAPLISATPYLTHNFTNSTTNLVCVTAQLEFDCPAAPINALGVVAYLGTFDPNNPSTNYLGDIGLGGPPYPVFSFQVPPGANFTLVVMAQATNLPCGGYTLHLFGLPCPPPILAIQPEPTAAHQVRVNWSTAYPGFAAQQSSKLNGQTFTNVIQSPVILNSRYSLTNLPATTNQFYRLIK